MGLGKLGPSIPLKIVFFEEKPGLNRFIFTFQGKDKAFPGFIPSMSAKPLERGQTDQNI